MEYKNPIIPGFNPDPSICKVNKEYYLVTSTFEYFPGVPIYKSHNLVDWKLIGHCLTRKSQLNLDGLKSSQGIFAPTLRYINGLFYMITTCVGGCGHFYVTAEDPSGEWSDPVFIKGDGFDPDLFQDEDGKVYFTRQNMSGGIIQFEIDLKTGELINEGKIIWMGFEDNHCEGPHIYKVGRWYYLLAAEGGTHIGHMCVVGRSEKVYGPYMPYDKNPILTHRGRTDTDIKATGHGDLIQDEAGHWWIVFLGIRQVGDWNNGFWHHLGRETFLAPVEFNEEGWPIVNRNNPVTINMLIPERSIEESNCSKDEGLVYYRRGNKNGKIIEINERDKVNIVYAEDTLCSDMPSNLLAVKQSHFECRLEAELLTEIIEGQEAGLTVIMNESYHYEIAARKSAVDYEIFFRRTVGDISFIQNRVLLPIEEDYICINLFIKCDKYQYMLGYCVNGKDYMVGKGSTKFLSSEVAAGFTGVFLGVYATGKGTNYKESASFQNITYSFVENN